MRSRLCSDPRVGGLADERAGRSLGHELNLAVKEGVAPSFSEKSALAHYTLDRCYYRVGIVYKTLMSDDTVMSALRAELFESGKEEIHVMSVGGGPGFDAVAVALIAALYGTCKTVRCSVFDREPGWEDLFLALASHLEDLLANTADTTMQQLCFQKRFETCDICLPLSDPQNHKLAETLRGKVDLGNFVYLVHENAAKLRAMNAPVSQGIGGIFPDMFQAVSANAHNTSLLFLDSSPFLWPSFVAQAQSQGLVAYLPGSGGRGLSREPLLVSTAQLLKRGCSDRVAQDRMLDQLTRHESWMIASETRRARSLRDRKRTRRGGAGRQSPAPSLTET